MRDDPYSEDQDDPQSPEEADRRIFMKRAIFGLGLLPTGVLGINIGRYFASPIWDKRTDNFVPICSLAALPKGTPFSIDYVLRQQDGWETEDIPDSMWLLREDNDEVVAYNKSCTHLGCPYRWDENENIFKCPCHTATFAKDGKVLSGPPERPLDRFPVKVENGMVLVKPETVKKEEA